MLADRVVVPHIEHVHKETSNPSIIRETTNQSLRTNPPSCNKSNINKNLFCNKTKH